MSKVKLNIKNWNGDSFHLSDYFADSKFTEETLKAASGNEMEFYLISEIKGTLDIEGDGSSRKIIKDLISGKRTAKNDNEKKAINLYSVMNYIKQTKPAMNKVNLMIIYNMLKMDINMGDDNLENDLDYRQSDEDGFIGKFKTPSQKVMREGLDNLFKFINSDIMSESIVEKSLLIQVLFIYFHPFYDFNGRTGRLLTYWFLNISGCSEISNSVYMSLPENKKKYVEMFVAMRKFKWSDLTTFLNFLMSVTAYGINKTLAIKDIENKKGISLNSTEKLIMFYLIDRKGWSLVNDLELKINLGISKQGIHNAVKSLTKKEVVLFKKVSNKSFVAPNIIMRVDISHPIDFFYKVWVKDMRTSNLTIEKTKVDFKV